MAVKPIVKTFEYSLDRLLRGFKKDQGREPNNLEMILIKQEAGNKAKDANKVIEVQFGKPFGEEVDELIKSGDVKIGEVTKKNDNVLQREMFQNSNLNKPTIEGQMEKITGASNRIDEIMKEQADMYRPKTDEEIAAKFERQNKEAAERLRKKMKNEPEDKADGGRAGYGLGSLIQPAKANQNQNTSGVNPNQNTSGVDPRMNLDYDTLVEQNVDKRLQDPNFLNNIQGVKPPLEKLYPVEPGKDEEFITQPGFPDRDGDGLDD